MITLLLQFFLFTPQIYCSSFHGYFWHVSDFHLDSRYGVNSSQSVRDIFLGQYDEGCWNETRNDLGDYNCDSPLSLVQVHVTLDIRISIKLISYSLLCSS